MHGSLRILLDSHRRMNLFQAIGCRLGNSVNYIQAFVPVLKLTWIQIFRYSVVPVDYCGLLMCCLWTGTENKARMAKVWGMVVAAMNVSAKSQNLPMTHQRHVRLKCN